MGSELLRSNVAYRQLKSFIELQSNRLQNSTFTVD